MKIIHLETRESYYIDFQMGRGEERMTCPVCSSTRKKKSVKCFSWNHDKEMGFCSHCQAKFVAHSEQVDNYVKPEWKNNTVLSEKAVKWFESRGISQFTLREMKVTESVEFMPQVAKEVNTIQFNYFRDGELINVKYRDARKNFKLHSGSELIVYNYDNVKDSKQIVIVEGEMDCLSLYECGIHNAISVPNGAGKGVINLQYIDNCIELFGDDVEIIIATDNDSPGINLRNELASRLGIERCKRVDFGKCKDANEFLTTYGAITLNELITHAKPFPIEGAFTVRDFNGELDALYEHGLSAGLQLGFQEFDKLISFETQRLYTITGIPGHGKSEFVDEIVVRLNAAHGYKAAFFSPENVPLQLHASKIIEKISGKRFNKFDLKRAELEMVKDYYSDNFYHILPENDFTIDTILSRARGLIKQKGIKILVIDPYNTIEHKRQNGMTEHEYISMFLDVLRNFAKRNNIIIFLVAHPTKMKKEQGIFEIPDMYSISGSSNFYNKTDFGMTVYLNSGGITEIHVNKVKFKHLGQKGIAYFQWEYSNGRYYERIDGMPYIIDNKNLIEKQEIIQDYEPNTESDTAPNTEFDTEVDADIPF